MDNYVENRRRNTRQTTAEEGGGGGGGGAYERCCDFCFGSDGEEGARNKAQSNDGDAGSFFPHQLPQNILKLAAECSCAVDGEDFVAALELAVAVCRATWY